MAGSASSTLGDIPPRPSRARVTLPIVSSLFAITGGATGLVGNIYAIFALSYMEYKPNTSLLMWYLLGSNFSFMLIALFFGCYLGYAYHNANVLLERLRTQRTNIENELENQRRMANDHEQRVNHILNHLSYISAHRTGVTDYLLACQQHAECSPDRIRRKFFDYVDHTLNNVREIFSTYTGFRCAACIKLFATNNPFAHSDTGQSPYVVHTFRRDSLSYPQRRGSDDDAETFRYSYKRNTGFAAIIDDTTITGCYICNDLAKHEQYRHTNPNWHDYYNSTAISLIKDPAQAPKQGVLAFLCVDSKEGQFDRPFTEAVLSLISNNLFFAFRNTYLIMRQLEQQQKGHQQNGT